MIKVYIPLQTYLYLATIEAAKLGHEFVSGIHVVLAYYRMKNDFGSYNFIRMKIKQHYGLGTPVDISKASLTPCVKRALSTYYLSSIDIKGFIEDLRNDKYCDIDKIIGYRGDMSYYES